MKFTFVFCLLFTLYSVAYCQQDPMFTRYMFINNMAINPSAVVRTNGHQLTMGYRNQWNDVPGAPTTFGISYQSSIQNQKAGLGVNVFHDAIGLDNHTAMHINYGYNIVLNQKWTLALGLKGGASFINSKYSEAITPNPSQLDPVYASSNQHFIPKIGAGMLIYSDKVFFGISAPTLGAFIPNEKFSFYDEKSFLSHHIYANAGYVVKLDDNIDMKPSLFIKYQHAAPLQIDLATQFWYKDLIAIGFNYRTGDAFSFILDIAANKNIVVSYAFDATYSRFREIGSNAHEIIFSYQWQTGALIPSIHKISDIPRF